MTWDQIDLESGQARLLAKDAWIDVTLHLRAIELLNRVPKSRDSRVFTMSSNALDTPWDGIRIKALRPLIQFRNRRHVSATVYANAGFDSRQKQKVLTHESPHIFSCHPHSLKGTAKPGERSTSPVIQREKLRAGLPDALPRTLAPPPANGTDGASCGH